MFERANFKVIRIITKLQIYLNYVYVRIIVIGVLMSSIGYLFMHFQFSEIVLYDIEIAVNKIFNDITPSESQ